MATNKVDLATEVAAKAHRDQVRKGTDVPYISHPCAVGLILAQAGCTEDVVAAGVLHDTVEDTPVTLRDIERDFGENVARLVAACSEPDKSGSWEDRKRHTLDLVGDAPLDVCMVVCADKLHNVRSILAERAVIGDRIWERFRRGKAQQAWYYRGLVASMEHHRRPLFCELREAVEALFDDERTTTS